MQAKIASKSQLKAEIKELNELCDLYIQSNPDWDKRNKAPELTAKDVAQAVSSSLKQLSQVLTLKALADEDASFLEASPEQLVALGALASEV